MRMMAAGPLPDAVVGVNDEVAIGVPTGLRQGGVDVPRQVSIAGIDDTRPARFVELNDGQRAALRRGRRPRDPRRP
jgi:LacI family transcriptional regulator